MIPLFLAACAVAPSEEEEPVGSTRVLAYDECRERAHELDCQALVKKASGLVFGSTLGEESGTREEAQHPVFRVALGRDEVWVLAAPDGTTRVLREIGRGRGSGRPVQGVGVGDLTGDGRLDFALRTDRGVEQVYVAGDDRH